MALNFPGFRVIAVPNGFRVQCRQCFRSALSGWRPPGASLVDLPAVRRWVRAHEHLLAFDQAKSEVLAAAASGHKGAKQWLSGHDGTHHG